MTSHFSSLPCDWCGQLSPCRFQWLTDTGYPMNFCDINCTRIYVEWQESEARWHALQQECGTETVMP